ncbi:hypothetical protein PBNK5_33320 [Pectobacterium brasiliense]
MRRVMPGHLMSGMIMVRFGYTAAVAGGRGGIMRVGRMCSSTSMYSRAMRVCTIFMSMGPMKHQCL